VLKIYIFKTGLSAYKIGVSSNVEKRRNQVQTGCPTKVDVFKVYEVERAYEVETIIHNYFSDFSTGREWFDIPESRMAAILEEIEAVVRAANENQNLSRWVKENSEEIQRFRSALTDLKFSARRLDPTSIGQEGF
jgi:hypothetical protein